MDRAASNRTAASCTVIGGYCAVHRADLRGENGAMVHVVQPATLFELQVSANKHLALKYSMFGKMNKSHAASVLFNSSCVCVSLL